MMRPLLFFLAIIVMLPGSQPVRAAQSSSEGFLVPGVDFSKLVLTEGAWCRYRIADEALGTVDSSEVYIGVTSAELTAQGPAFWLEIENRPVGAERGDANVMKILVLEGIRDFEIGDSLGRYIVRLYNKNGDHPPLEEDPKAYKGFSQVIPTTDSSWVATPDVPTVTAGGNFNCVKKERVVVDDREVLTGNVKLVKKARDDFTVWFSDDIPVFRLVRCEIFRVRQTETVPKIKGIPVTGEKNSRTTAELIGFGFDASPILPGVGR